MAENPYKTPTDDRITGADGRLFRVWKRFLANIETLGARQSEPVAVLDDQTTPTNDELRDKINELIAAMTAAQLMKED